MRVGPAGNVYVADTNRLKFREITPEGLVTTLAGDGHPGYDQGVGTQARFFGPLGVADHVSGNPWVADADDGYSGGCRPKRTCRARDAHGVRYWKRAWDRSSGSRFTASTASARVNAALPSCGRRFHKRSCLLSRIRTNASLLIDSTEYPSHCHDCSRYGIWELR